MSIERPLESLSDEELLRGLAHHLSQSRRSESDLVAHVGEVEIRGLHAHEATPSMFVYCIGVLHLSEAEAYLRIAAARAARDHPVLLAMLADGRLHLSGIAKLAPHLTRENRDVLLSRAVHKTKRQIEELLAEWAPRPDVPGVMRKLPVRPVPALLPEVANIQCRPDGAAPTAELGLDGVAASADPAAVPSVELGLGRVPSSRSVPVPLVQPLSPARYKVQFTAGAELYEKLERLRALMRQEVPDGDLAAIIEKAVSEKLERLEARRFARTGSPRKALARTDFPPSSRHIPASVRRLVHQRDKVQCCFVDARGRRCPERHRLEYHHRHPFGFGGDHDPDNICLMCPTHNRLMAELDYGRKALARHRDRQGKLGPGRSPTGVQGSDKGRSHRSAGSQ